MPFHPHNAQSLFRLRQQYASEIECYITNSKPMTLKPHVSRLTTSTVAAVTHRRIICKDRTERSSVDDGASKEQWDYCLVEVCIDVA